MIPEGEHPASPDLLNDLDGPKSAFALSALGMEWYLRCYVTALQATQDGLGLETLSTFGRTRTTVRWADVELAGARQ